MGMAATLEKGSLRVSDMDAKEGISTIKTCANAKTKFDMETIKAMREEHFELRQGMKFALEKNASLPILGFTLQ